MDGLIAEHISKTYAGTHGLSFAALRDVSIRLEPGSFTSLVGESGSGKSTLARLLVGLEAPDRSFLSATVSVYIVTDSTSARAIRKT